jgi:hypothetical protein
LSPQAKEFSILEKSWDLIEEEKTSSDDPNQICDALRELFKKLEIKSGNVLRISFD